LSTFNPDNTDRAVLEQPALAPYDYDDPQTVTRRNLLKWVIRIGYGTFALAFLVPALALKALSLERKVVEAGDQLVYAAGGQAGQPLRASEVQPNSAVLALPQNKGENQENTIIVVRTAPGQGADGLVAYSAICTHLGCSVLGRLVENNIACPCHASRFDPRNNAAVVGGPAGHPLPSLPVTVSPDGVIAATGGFSGPIGPRT
jgi:rieske iron-sulfur protein